MSWRIACVMFLWVCFYTCSRPELRLGICSSYDAKSPYAAKVALEEGLLDDIMPVKNVTVQLIDNGFSCGKQLAMTQGVEFFVSENPVHAVVGCSCSTASMALMILADTYRIPMVSGAATNEQLSDKTSYKYFSRVISPDSMQSLCMARLVVHFGWQRQLVIMHDKGVFSTGLATKIRNLLEEIGRQSNILYGIVFEHLPIEEIGGRDIDIVAAHDQSLMDAVASRIAMLRPQPRIFIAPAMEITTSLILQTFRMSGLVNNETVWILADTLCDTAVSMNWPFDPLSTSTQIYDDALELGNTVFSNDGNGAGQYDRKTTARALRGMLCFTPMYDASRLNNIAWQSFWKNLTADKLLAAGMSPSMLGVDNEDFILYKSSFPSNHWNWLEFDATLALLVAASTLMQSGLVVSESRGEKLLNAVRDTNFQGLSGRIKFDANGDRMSSYITKNLQLDASGVPVLVTVGSFHGATQTLSFSEPPIFADGTTTIPLDRSRPCSVGQAYDTFSQGCSSCKPGTYAPVADSDYCIPCAEGRFTSASGRKVCSACPVGTISSRTAATACKSCAIGNFSSQTGASACKQCTRGQYSDLQASSECNSCKTSSFQSKEGQSACISCGVMSVGADNSSGCVFLWNLLVAILSGLIIVILVLFLAWWQRRRFWHLQKKDRYDHLKKCIRQANDMLFPMNVVSARDTLRLASMTRFEDLCYQGVLTSYNSLAAIKHAMKESGIKIVFVSHQWLGFDHPDPRNIQFELLKVCIREISVSFGWDLDKIMVWLDFHCIPQTRCAMQFQAIASLPIYASVSSAFVVLAPDACHQDTGLVCNSDTYKRRLWCRVEMLSHYMRRGQEAMYIFEQSKLKLLEHSWLTDAFFVFEGDCACCFRKHEGMKCDKPFVRDLLLGIYAEVLWNKDKGSSSQQERASEIYKAMHEQKHRVFPDKCSTEFVRGSSSSFGSAANATLQTGGSSSNLSLSLSSVRRTSHGSNPDVSKKTSDKVGGMLFRDVTRRTIPLFGPLLLDLEAYAQSEDDRAVALFGEVEGTQNKKMRAFVCGLEAEHVHSICDSKAKSAFGARINCTTSLGSIASSMSKISL